MSARGAPPRLVIGEALIDIVERDGRVTRSSMSAAAR